jgi:polyhydroxyalkanoate synthase subunit PhaE
MTASPFDFGLEAVAAFWTQAGKAMLDAQQAFTQGITSAAAAMSAPSEDALPQAALPNAAELAKATGAVAELWTKAARLAGTMVTSVSGSPGLGKIDPTMVATFQAMADPRSWLAGLGGLDVVVTRALEGPQLADLWNAERQQARVVQAWMHARQRALEHSGIVLEAWLRAAQTYAEEFGGAGDRTVDSKALMARWTETANRVLLETQRSAPYLATQAAMIRAGTELRLAQQATAERWAEQFSLPTRTEVDDLTRTVTELRRELRAMRRKTRRGPAPKATRKGKAVATSDGEDR